MSSVIAFQGQPGAYSDLACRVAYPGMTTLPCESFEAAIEAVREGRAQLGMLPCENSLAGRVPDIHYLLPGSGLYVVGEHFHRVEHCLLAPKGATIAGLKRVHSHPVALDQVRHLLRELGVTAVVQADTAGAAGMVAQWNNHEDAAIASSLAAEIYGLEILRSNVEDAAHNTNSILRDGAKALDARSSDAESDDDVCVPCQERTGSAVQGDGWVRDQWREPDQARELHDLRPVRCDTIPVRC